MKPETTPAEISQRRFKTSLRGFERDEVTAFLADIAAYVEELVAQRDRLAGRLGDFAGRDLQSEFASIGNDVAAILETARMAAEGMRERASTDAARWRSEAMAEAEDLVRTARSDAEHLRGDAWTTSEELLKQAQAEARRIRDVAERDALTVLGEAEREAHRLTASARRESDDQLRTARVEAEQLVTDAGARHDELLGQASRQAESAQERARALEQRRQELMAELEALRASLSRMEGELDERRQGLGLSEPSHEEAASVVAPGKVGPEEGKWEPGETVRVIHRGKPSATKVPDAEEIAEEVRRIRREASPPEPPVVTVPIEQITTPIPAPIAAPAAIASVGPAARGPGDDLSDIFRRLRTPTALGDEPAPSEDPVADTPLEASTQEPSVGQPPIPNEAFELRDRWLLPITNRSLRNLKRQLTELQNHALENLRVSEGAWRPSKEAIIDPLRAELSLLAVESFAAGHAAAEEMIGERLPRPPAPGREESPDFGSALVERLTSVLDPDAQGVRAAGAAVSMVFRSWRTDEAERRVRDLANSAYHRGLRSSLEGSRRKLSWVVSGRGCASCRGAAEKGSETPPAHPGCGCTLVTPAVRTA